MGKGKPMDEETKQRLRSIPREKRVIGKHLRKEDWYIAYDVLTEQGYEFQPTLRYPALGKLKYCNDAATEACRDLLPYTLIDCKQGPRKWRLCYFFDLFDLKALVGALHMETYRYTSFFYFGEVNCSAWARKHTIFPPRRELIGLPETYRCKWTFLPVKGKRVSIADVRSALPRKP